MCQTSRFRTLWQPALLVLGAFAVWWIGNYKSLWRLLALLSVVFMSIGIVLPSHYTEILHNRYVLLLLVSSALSLACSQWKQSHVLDNERLTRHYNV